MAFSSSGGGGLWRVHLLATVLSSATAFLSAPRGPRVATPLTANPIKATYRSTSHPANEVTSCWGIPRTVVLLHAKSPATTADPELEKERAKDFAKHSNKDKRMSLDGLLATDEIRELIKDSLISEDEVQDIWIQIVGPSLKASVDFEGFMKVHDAIDSLFEQGEPEEEGDHMRAEFNMLCRGGKKVSLDAFMELPEMQEFLDEGALSGEEVEDLYNRVVKPGELGLDYEGFVKLYQMVDDLFEEAGDYDKAAEASAAATPKKATSPTPSPQPRQQQAPSSAPKQEWEPRGPSAGTAPLTPGAYFARFSDNGEMNLEVLAKTPSVKELLDEGSLKMEELKDMYAEVSKGAATVDFRGFQKVLDMVDDLFEDEEDEEEAVVQKAGAMAAAADPSPPKTPASTSLPSGIPAPSEFTAGQDAMEIPEGERVDPKLAKGVLQELAASISLVQQLQVEDEPDPSVLALINSLTKSPANLANDMDLALEDIEDVLVGEWELVYTTSRSMKYNSGLTGLCNTLPQAELLGVTQTISLDNFDSYDVYTNERLMTLGKNFDAVIDGTWELLSTYAIMTGEPVLTLNIEPIRIKYGALTDSMETGWKGARVLNRCEVVYLDDDMRVMKGGSNDCFFVWYRKEEK